MTMLTNIFIGSHSLGDKPVRGDCDVYENEPWVWCLGNVLGVAGGCKRAVQYVQIWGQRLPQSNGIGQ